MGKELIIYKNGELEIPVKVEIDGDTVWLNRKDLSILFDRDIKTIGKHINNILKEELDNSVIANFATTATDGKTYQIEHYNLDMIISLGYRVKSKRGIDFRKWATNILKEYMLKGYALNEKKLMDNKRAFLETLDNLNLLVNDNKLIKSSDILELIRSFSNTWFTLDRFDKSSFPKVENSIDSNILVSELYKDIEILKNELIRKKEATIMFAQEKNKDALAGIFGNVFQSVFGQDVYPSVEEKAAHLLYFVVKNHPFNDGNKRSGAFSFIWLLNKFGYNFIDKINPQALSTLTLVIANSDPKEKDKMVGLVKLLLN
ncbi:virulence protein RhuM/Fic/DOC family protein [Oceanivirga salmonicida]|uniref:virulence protein RhuM/Fic/DOC family protein n=1 Tax=Oceanivirga salmonicida TaxID=1769291 RepID=UPI0009E6A41C|nr:virulence protein RhuM/Fic/DOC family protein [Oceanivirga salmonicida]